MTPDDLEARLAGRPTSAIVTAALGELRSDADWTVTEMTLGHRIVAVEMVHHPSGTAYTLSRPSGRLHMRPSQGEWLTAVQAAERLGLSVISIRSRMHYGTIASRKVGKHLHLISAEEVERYRRDHLGHKGWHRRRDPDYQPSPEALWQRRYRDRKRAHDQAQQPADSPAQEGRSMKEVR